MDCETCQRLEVEIGLANAEYVNARMAGAGRMLVSQARLRLVRLDTHSGNTGIGSVRARCTIG